MLAAVAAGLVVGGVIALLVAPNKGAETRRKIQGRKKKWLDIIKDNIKVEQEKLKQAEEKINQLLKEKLSCTTVEPVNEVDIDTP